MPINRLPRLCVASLVFLSSVCVCFESYATQLWIAAEDPYTSAQFAPGSSQDFMEMFSPQSTWQRDVPGLAAVKLYEDFIGDATDAQLQQAFSWAKSNDLAIAVEGGLLPVSSPAQCGWGVEGYDDAIVGQLAHVASLGGVVSYFSMDESLYFGTMASGVNTCHSSISEVAEKTSETYERMLSIFPKLKLVDIEPIPLVDPLDYSEWLGDLSEDLPEKLSSFQADIVWGLPYQNDLGSIDGLLSSASIDPGAIVDAASGNDSNALWEQSALSNAQQVETDPRTCVGTLIVQTWNPDPTLVLPTSEPGTLSNIASVVGHTYSGQSCTPSAVPEPSSASLILVALGGLLLGMGRAPRRASHEYPKVG